MPTLTTKGGQWHKRLGKVFVLSAYGIGVSALLSPIMRVTGALASGISWTVIMSEAGFLILLGYLGVVTFDAAYFGTRILRTRRNPEELASPLSTILTVLMMAGSLIVAGHALLFWSRLSIVMLLLSPFGLLGALDKRRYEAQQVEGDRAWFYAHMDAMLGAGIAFHTAFLIFGSQALFDYSILGPFNWVPWVVPAIVGTVGGSAWKRRYMRKFGDLPAESPAPA